MLLGKSNKTLCMYWEYLKTYTYIKSLNYNLVITCDEIIDMLEIVSTNSNDKKATYKINYYHISHTTFHW